MTSDQVPEPLIDVVWLVENSGTRTYSDVVWLLENSAGNEKQFNPDSLPLNTQAILNMKIRWVTSCI